VPTFSTQVSGRSSVKCRLVAQHYAVLLYSYISSRGVRLFLITAEFFCGDGNRRRGVVLRACLFRQAYHVEGSWLHRFAWFRRQQELHFVHHRHANSNFGVIHFFWDKILGTYRTPDAGA